MSGDSLLLSTARGTRVLKISLAVMGAATLVEAGLALASGSAGLVAGTIR